MSQDFSISLSVKAFQHILAFCITMLRYVEKPWNCCKMFALHSCQIWTLHNAFTMPEVNKFEHNKQLLSENMNMGYSGAWELTFSSHLPGIFSFSCFIPGNSGKKQGFTPRKSAKLCYTPQKLCYNSARFVLDDLWNFHVIFN